MGAGIFHFFNEPYNPAFLENPDLVKFHAGLGAIYLGLAPLQFVSTVRTRWPGYHRIAGRILTSIALVIGLTAIFIGLFMPFSGLAEQVVISIFGIYFLVSLVNGFVCIRSR